MKLVNYVRFLKYSFSKETTLIGCWASKFFRKFESRFRKKTGTTQKKRDSDFSWSETQKKPSKNQKTIYVLILFYKPTTCKTPRL